MTILMKCGHSANATRGDGKPCCAICFGDPNSSIMVDPPDLAGRKARCAYYDGRRCGSERESSIDLAFFEHRPSREFDQFYCGRFGWD